MSSNPQSPLVPPRPARDALTQFIAVCRHGYLKNEQREGNHNISETDLHTLALKAKNYYMKEMGETEKVLWLNNERIEKQKYDYGDVRK